MVVHRVMDKNSISKVWVQIENVGTFVTVLFVCISEGVTHPEVHCGHVALPVGGAQYVLLYYAGGVQ